MLHHDAITGTHTQKVGADYDLMMKTARETAQTKYSTRENAEKTGEVA